LVIGLNKIFPPSLFFPQRTFSGFFLFSPLPYSCLIASFFQKNFPPPSPLALRPPFLLVHGLVKTGFSPPTPPFYFFFGLRFLLPPVSFQGFELSTSLQGVLGILTFSCPPPPVFPVHRDPPPPPAGFQVLPALGDTVHAGSIPRPLYFCPSGCQNSPLEFFFPYSPRSDAWFTKWADWEIYGEDCFLLSFFCIKTPFSFF